MMTQPRGRKVERGGILVMFAVLMVPLLFVLSLAIDAFLLMTADLQQENNAEFSAEAAALQLWVRPRDPDADGCVNEVRTAQCQVGEFSVNDALSISNMVAQNNIYVLSGGNEGALVADNSLQMGCWDGATFTAIGTSQLNPNCGANFRAVRVRLGVESGARLIPLLSKAVGYQEFRPTASAVAWVNSGGTAVSVKRGA